MGHNHTSIKAYEFQYIGATYFRVGILTSLQLDTLQKK